MAKQKLSNNQFKTWVCQLADRFRSESFTLVSDEELNEAISKQCDIMPQNKFYKRCSNRGG